VRSATKVITTVFALGLAAAIGACGGVDGEGLFAQRTIEGRAGCVACHSVASSDIVIGPTLSQIGSVAGERIPGVDAETYIRDSILLPDAHIAPGYQPGEMPSGWGEVLSDDEIDALVAYLLELR
jgi:mono/diheme cytochrome c family protein